MRYVIVTKGSFGTQRNPNDGLNEYGFTEEKVTGYSTIYIREYGIYRTGILLVR